MFVPVTAKYTGRLVVQSDSAFYFFLITITTTKEHLFHYNINNRRAGSETNKSQRII